MPSEVERIAVLESEMGDARTHLVTNGKSIKTIERDVGGIKIDVATILALTNGASRNYRIRTWAESGIISGGGVGVLALLLKAVGLF